MQLKFKIPFFKEAPFVRLLLPLAIGILLQWYLQINIKTIVTIFCGFCVIGVIVFVILYKTVIQLAFAKSVALKCLIFCLGLLLSFINNVKNNPNYIGKTPTENTPIILSLTEPLVEKTKSYKANATLRYIVDSNNIQINKTGNVIVYFKKDSILPNLEYGSTIVINKQLQLITNSGNPGAFNYAQQSLFKGFTHQLFLTKNDYALLAEKHTTVLQSFLYKTQKNVLAIISKYITGEKEKGIAEALLIGYKDDLDKDLNQAYSNTGTIHVIAISGLHLGFIYMLLVIAFKPLHKVKKLEPILKFFKPIFIIAILWLFSLLAGGAASILRSAIMFTCIVIGDSLQRKSSIYNNLAVSAFIILCIMPYSLWDVGFQLSYAAVLSIVVFMKPIYNLIYTKNKALNWLWQLTAVTLSAQILTLPITIYHFHQFPNLFLITNIVAVPLSTIILGVELFLLLFSWFQPVAIVIGKLCNWLIALMNNYIEWCNGFSFAVTDYLQISLLYCYIMYAFIIATAYWLLQKYKPALFVALSIACILAFGYALQHYNISKQNKLIVYNIPKQQAADFIVGNKFHFIGDTTVEQNILLKNFHLKPARIQFQTNQISGLLKPIIPPLYAYNSKLILIWNKTYNFKHTTSKVPINIVIISNNPKLYIDSLANAFTIQQVVADGSNPAWKIKLWQKDCERLKIPFHSTNDKGAFLQSFR